MRRRGVNNFRGDVRLGKDNNRSQRKALTAIAAVDVITQTETQTAKIIPPPEHIGSAERLLREGVAYAAPADHSAIISQRAGVRVAAAYRCENAGGGRRCLPEYIGSPTGD